MFNFTNSNGYSNTRTTPSREAEGRNGNQRDYSQNRTNPSRQTAPQKTATQRDNSQNRRFLQEKVGHKEMKVKEIILKPELTHLDKLLLKEPKRRDNSQDRENLPEKLRHKDKKFRENSQNRGGIK
jgi:hypothetical protein